LFNLLFLFVLSTIFVIAWKAQHLRVHTINTVRRYCEKRDLLLLDETVVLAKRHFRWRQGWQSLKREWHFEFTTTGEERYPGKAYTVGAQLVDIQLPPHRLSPYEPHSPH